MSIVNVYVHTGVACGQTFPRQVVCGAQPRRSHRHFKEGKHIFFRFKLSSYGLFEKITIQI